MIDLVLLTPALILFYTDHWLIALVYLALIVIVPYVYYSQGGLTVSQQAFWDNLQSDGAIKNNSLTYSVDTYTSYDYDSDSIPEFPQ